jgi:parallel beta-helix repeat protein
MMSLTSLLRWFLAQDRRSKRKSPPRRLELDVLEDRLAPAVLHVGATESYTTIQSAIDAGNSGDTVAVDPGLYQEQLTISKSITVVAVSSSDLCDHGNSAIIEAPTTLGAPTVANPDAIVHITGAGVSAEVAGFVIKGASATAGTPNLLYGVRIDGNAFGHIEANAIKDIIDSSDGSFGVGISVGNASDSGDGLGAQVGSALIDLNSIVNYQRAGIIVSNTGSTANIVLNNIAGSTTFTADSITGVEVSNGAVANVAFNAIANNTNPNNAVQNGVGVFLFSPGQGTEIENNAIWGNDYGVFGSNVNGNGTSEGQGVSVENNVITNNTFVGIEFDNSSVLDISYNYIAHNGSQNLEDGGIFLFQSTGNLLVSNQSVNNNGSGIFVDAGSTNNTFQGNTFTGNIYDAAALSADAVDLTVGSGSDGTANSWINDAGNTSITVSGQSVLKKSKPQHFHLK